MSLDANWLVMIFTGVLAAVAIAQLIAATMQAWWTREALLVAKLSADAATRAVEIADRSSSNQLRAYVSYMSTKLVHLGGGEPTAQITIKNLGQTPANKIVVHGKMVLAPAISRELTVDVTRDGQAVGSLGPGAEMFFHLDMPPSMREQLLDLKEGRAVVQVCAGVQYEDVFGVTRTTNINVSANAVSLRGGNANLVTLPFGNEAS